MKRQINIDEGESEAKKSKPAVEKEEGNFGAVGVENFFLGLEELPWLIGGLDEVMSWGSVWLPFWDVEFISQNYDALFSDVVWDDDIWNLKSINP